VCNAVARNAIEEFIMARSRSAISGRFISRAAAARHPRTSVAESGRNASSGTHHRSAITGRYISAGTAARHPNTSVSERG
jgi:hypothetical protein